MKKKKYVRPGRGCVSLPLWSMRFVTVLFWKTSKRGIVTRSEKPQTFSSVTRTKKSTLKAPRRPSFPWGSCRSPQDARRPRGSKGLAPKPYFGSPIDLWHRGAPGLLASPTIIPLGGLGSSFVSGDRGSNWAEIGEVPVWEETLEKIFPPQKGT